MIRYTNIHITDGATEKQGLFINILTKDLSVNDIVALLNFESKKPVWMYFILFTQYEAIMHRMSFNKNGLSGVVSVNDNRVEVEPFDSHEGSGLISALKLEAVKQYIARGAK